MPLTRILRPKRNRVSVQRFAVGSVLVLIWIERVDLLADWAIIRAIENKHAISILSQELESGTAVAETLMAILIITRVRDSLAGILTILIDCDAVIVAGSSIQGTDVVALIDAWNSRSLH